MKNLTTKIQRLTAFILLLAMTTTLAACGTAHTADKDEWVTITVDHRRNNFQEFLPPTHKYSFKIGESCDIINPEIEGFVTAWPIIHLDEIQHDEHFTVQYFEEGEYGPEELAEMTSTRTIIVRYDYRNGAHGAAETFMQELPVGSSFRVLSPHIENYEADCAEIFDTVQTNCPPGGAKSYTVTYDFAGDPADEPFQLSVDYSFETTVAENAAWYIRSTDFYWYTENEEFNIELPQFVGFRTEQTHLTGTMARENRHILVRYTEDPTQTDGETLEQASTPPSIAMDTYPWPGVVWMD